MTSALINVPSDLLREIITHVPLSDLMQLCSVDTTIQKICNNDRLLAQVIAEQTGHTIKPEQFTWKQFASLLARDEIRQVNVIYQGETIGQIWYWADKKLAQVENELLSIYPGNETTVAFKFSSPIYPGNDITSFHTAPSIYLVVPGMYYQKLITISEYMNSKESIWIYSDEIVIIDDPITINKIPGRCRRCKSFNTETTDVQTRSADEPMSIRQQCLDCGHQMRY